jgi:hypothetical protein
MNDNPFAVAYRAEQPNDNPFTVAYLGGQVLDEPTLLPTLVSPATPDNLRHTIEAAWTAFLSDPTDDRWVAFSLVLVAADGMGLLSTDDMIAIGRKWANKMPLSGIMPPEEVITMFAPHLEAAGKLAVDPDTKRTRVL